MKYRRSQMGRRIELLESRRMLAPVFRVQDIIDNGDIEDTFSLSWAIEGANIWNDLARGPTSLESNSNYGSGTGVDASPNYSNAPTIQFWFPFIPRQVTNGYSCLIHTLMFSMALNLTAPGNPVIIDARFEAIDGGVNFDIGFRMNTAGSNTPTSVSQVTIANIFLIGFDSTALSIDNSGNFDIVIDDVIIQENNATGIAITNLPTSIGSVTIKNSTITNNEGGILIADSSPPGSPGNVSIRNNVIRDSNQFGISTGRMYQMLIFETAMIFSQMVFREYC